MTHQSDDTPGVLAPPPLITLGLIAAGLILDSFWTIRLPSLPPPLDPLPGIVILVAGFALSAWSVLGFLHHRTHPDPYHPTTTLITSGPFRFSRNPIYVAFLLMHLGVGVWTAKLWVVAALLPAAAVFRYGVIGPEERYLERKFGETYLAYKQSVRRWI